MIATHSEPHRRHHKPGSRSLADAARAHLASQDVQWTDLRAAVFDVLAEADTPVSAYDVAELVSAARGKRIAATSIYRILDLFVAHNLATRVETRNAYVVNTHPNCPHDCIFLVCEQCASITHLDDDRLAKAMRSLAAATGFAPSRPVLEILGRCAACVAAG